MDHLYILFLNHRKVFHCKNKLHFSVRPLFYLDLRIDKHMIAHLIEIQTPYMFYILHIYHQLYQSELQVAKSVPFVLHWFSVVHFWK